MTLKYKNSFVLIIIISAPKVINACKALHDTVKTT